MAEVFYDPVFLRHDTRDHPECAARLSEIMRALRASARWPSGGERACPPASLEAVYRVHEPDYVAYVEELCASGGGMLDADTPVSARSYEAALAAAGAGIAAVEGVVKGEFPSAFCAVRPPGHHAMPDRGMGFCLFNNVAIAALHARESLGVGRVLIADWDVHHGNGSQATFDSDASVFYLSVHRHPHYPWTGRPHEHGTGEGEGKMLNVDLPVGAEPEQYLEAFERACGLAAGSFRPELVLVSAGFDGLRGDPLGGFKLLPETFGTMTDVLADTTRPSAEGRIVSMLEGGYVLDALGECARRHFERLP
jgi:acetoin utilization deacetylase AcuC-like enzyme